MARRSDITEGILYDIATHLVDVGGIYFMFELENGDERIANHTYTVFYDGDADDVAEQIFMDKVEEIGRQCDYDTARWRFTHSSKGDSTTSGGYNKFICTLAYEKKLRAEPVADASGVQVGRYERQKRGLFGAMYEYCVMKKLEEGDECCGGCRGEDDPLPDLPPTSYYLCENLHLLCRPCKQQWRVANGNKGCPACRNHTEYAYVITPPSASPSGSPLA